MSTRNISTATIEHAVQLACRAPSYHNSQPWRWVLVDDVLQLHLDRDHLVATDTSGRQALISCGAVLDHLQVAVAAAGWHADIERFPDPDNGNHLASIHFTAMVTVTPGHCHRADAILGRRTDRLPYRAPDDWPIFVEALAARISDSDAYVDSIDISDHDQLVHASELTDLLHLYNGAYHAELNWWTASFAINDGIPKSALVSAAESDRVEIARSFPVADHQNRRPQIAHDQAQILVISARDQTAANILRSGEALSKVLLEATMTGLATCTLTHLTEHQATSNIVSVLTGRPLPQVLIRVGVAPTLEDPPPPTPRRPLADVLTVRS